MLNTSTSFKQIKFGSNAAILKSRGEAISLDAIAQHAPAVLATEKHSSRSERYAFIDTRAVLEGLLAEGFGIFEVRQGGSRIEGKAAFTKHMLRLRYRGEEGAVSFIGQRDQIIPEIILTNAHDGTASYQLGAGLFRIVCTNGLVAGDLFAYQRVAHKGEVGHEVIDAAFKVVKQFPGVTSSANEMAALELDTGERLAFARAAQALRWDEGEAPIEETRLLDVRRPEDRSNDLWTVMNRTQENLIRGGQKYVRESRDEVTGRLIRRSRRQVAEVNGIDQTKGLNRALWTLAEEMKRLKAA